MTIPTAYKNGEQLEFILGKQIGAVTLENSLAVSYKVKCILTIWSSNSILCCLPNEQRLKELYKEIHSKCYRKVKMEFWNMLN